MIGLQVVSNQGPTWSPSDFKSDSESGLNVSQYLENSYFQLFELTRGTSKRAAEQKGQQVSHGQKRNPPKCWAIVTTSIVLEGLAPLRLGIEPRSPT